MSSERPTFPLSYSATSGARYYDLKGYRFGRLTVVERDTSADVVGNKQGVQWICRCDCGNTMVTRGSRLTKGDTKSCGCILRDLRKSGVFRRIHGLRRTRQYSMVHAARIRASKAGVPFDIELTDILIPERCPVLGIEFDSAGRETAPSLDKIRQEDGYVRGNIRVISTRANRLKSDASVEELRRILDYCEGRIP